MTEYGLVGERLGHSHSPEIHREIGGYDYKLIELSPSDVEGFFERRGFKGLNVTIPYKETVIPHLDFIDPAAKEIGAVNTVVNRDGKLYGYNTDKDGMAAAILRAKIVLKDKKVLILGTGGTSKTAEYVARSLGAADVVKVSRSGKDGAATYEEAYGLHSDAGVIINTTPVGMYPRIAECPVDITKFENLSGVFDAVFNPLRTELVLSAREHGITACGGLYMLVFQAVKSSELFTGKVCSKGLSDAIYSKLLRKLEDVVLTGMPSCGKTTVGKIVAEELGREFIDTDVEIEKNEARKISDIFADDGEVYFRDAETKEIAAAAKRTSVVIATGGGAVLRQENVRSLKRSGKIVFIDRSLDKLLSTPDRPLSSDCEMLERRYRERIDIYRATADFTVDGDGDAFDVAMKVINLFYDGEKE